MNALVAWLTSQMPGVTFDTRWPSPDRQLPAKMVTILMAGQRQDASVDTRVLASTNVGSNAASFRFQVKACTQPLQLDVWATSDVARDDILAQLDVALNASEQPAGVYNPDPAASGCLVSVGDGWEDTFADFDFEGPDIDDSPDSVKRAEFRATIRGECRAMLYVTKQWARQATITFQQKLHETDEAASTDEFETSTIT